MADRIIVKNTDAHPELWADLKQVTPRNRAERLRTLACIGLMVVKRGDAASLAALASEAKPPRTAALPPPPETVGMDNPVRKGLRARLKASVATTTSATTAESSVSPDRL